MKLGTRIFELAIGKYKSLPELAHAMGITASQIYRVRDGKRRINEKFIVGAVKAFPEHKLGNLFYVVPDGSEVGIVEDSRRDKVVKFREAGLSYAAIGRRLGMSRERARQIVESSLTLQKPDLLQKPALQPKAMLTISDAARFLNVHINTVRRWSDQGILKTYRIGPRSDRRFRREEVEAFLKG